MSTPRPTRILADLEARLKLATTVAGDNVERSRDKEMDEAELPIILLFAQDLVAREDAFLGMPRTYLRAMKLGIAAMLPFQAGLDDALYLIADQVEAVVLADETHGGQASQTQWERTRYDWTTQNVNTPYGWAELEFTVYYRDE